MSRKYIGFILLSSFARPPRFECVVVVVVVVFAECPHLASLANDEREWDSVLLTEV